MDAPLEFRQQSSIRHSPHITCFEANAAYAMSTLQPVVAEFLQRYFGDQTRLYCFATRNGTPHLHNTSRIAGLPERLKAMGLDEPGMVAKKTKTLSFVSQNVCCL